MVIVRFQGRLGNQMFQYAFAMSLAKKFKTFFLIDNFEQSIFLKYFRVEPISKWPFFYKKLLSVFGKYSMQKLEQSGNEPPENWLMENLDHRYYKGFFQSEKYFENVQALVKERFTIKKEFRKMFHDSFGLQFSEKRILAIHCRFGDYLNSWGVKNLGGENLSLPVSYYKNALNLISDITDYTIIVVTDDKALAEQLFQFIPVKFIVSALDIIDFQILQHAHKLIISNSSFSWWAAYLNINSAQVFAPQYWLGFRIDREWPLGIIPSRFIQVPVNELLSSSLAN